MTDDRVPVDMVLHIPGGLALADIGRKAQHQVQMFVDRPPRTPPTRESPGRSRRSAST